MSIGTWLHTKWNGKKIGEDIFGNVYYQHKKSENGNPPKRWVMYKGMAEPSKVPPLWHAWLHYMINDVPENINEPLYEWQKEHKPNLTGTVNAYHPPGHLQSGGQRDKTVSDYEAWTP